MQPMLTIALRAARRAGEFIVRAFERLDTVVYEQKGPYDYVSEVDKQAERIIIQQLQKAYPEHTILAEETGLIPGKQRDDGQASDYQWVIDPLDGTTNFLHGIPHFSVAIACKYRGHVQHAVIIDPIKQEEFTASRGQGAALNDRKIRIAERRGLEGALIGTGIPFNGKALERLGAYLETVAAIAGKTAGIRRNGSAALDLAYVAAGRFDGFWEMYLREWDIAAGSLLVQEAGGLISDFNGGNDYLQTGHLVCGAPKTFKPLLQIVQQHLGTLK